MTVEWCLGFRLQPRQMGMTKTGAVNEVDKRKIKNEREGRVRESSPWEKMRREIGAEEQKLSGKEDNEDPLKEMDAVVGVLADYTIKPILHQLDYLFHYKGNIKEVEKKLGILRTTERTVQILVNQDKGKGNAIFDGVTNWLDNVKNVLDMAQQNEAPNPSCFNCVQRHQLSRKAKKRLEDINELINEGRQFNKDNVGYPVPSPDTSSSTLPADYQFFESRTSMAEKIKDALANPNVNKVGVCGMGGVGKTTLLKEVKKLVLENKLFDRVIQVEVGQSKSVIHIQEEIRAKLNMEYLNMEFEEVRTSRLQTHIAEKKENILFMLDDLWKEYDVEKEFGIPYRSDSRIEGCKILMTSRRRDLFTNQMNIEKLFEVNSLTKEESWKFFSNIIGDEFVEDGYMKQIAKYVINECGGLPIALKILGKTLKGRRVEIWKDALKKLKNPVVVDIHGVSDQLYSCLQFSYDSIENEAKLLLLLCSVFPDDHRIYVDDLQKYAMGMGLLNQTNTWEDAKNRVIKLVDDLKSSYLLLAPPEWDDNYVKMHDVVHDFAKYIASKIDKMTSFTYGNGQRAWEEDNRHGSYNAIYVDPTTFLNLPPKLEFPNLQLFILISNGLGPRPTIQNLETVFEGMKELRVLDVRMWYFEPSLIYSLKNLRVLCLSHCDSNDIDAIGELKRLKILEIHFCRGIQEFPECTSKLTQLKVLQVSHCMNLKVIHPNIISKMTRLEDLSFSHSFDGWGEEVWYKQKLIRNAKLSELNCLTHLVHLELCNLKNVEILSNELSLESTQKLETCRIFVGDERWNIHYNDRNNPYNRKDKRYTTALNLYIDSPIDSIGGVFQILLQKCEKLVLRDSVGFTMLLCNTYANSCYPLLKHLEIDYPPAIIGNISPLNFDLQVAFPQLKSLYIGGRNNFETLWRNNGLTENYFSKLERIFIEGCNKFTYVFPSRMVRSLVFLNRLVVRYCELVERIFEIEESTSIIVNQDVPLTILELSSLPNLKYVWNNDPALELLTFPNLKKVKVEECPQLKTLFPVSFINHMKEFEELDCVGETEIFGETDEASQLVSPQIFPSLRYLTVHYTLMKRRSFWFRPESFSELLTLRLIGSEDDDMVSLPFEMSESAVWRSVVRHLQIENAFEWVKIFRNGEENNQNYHASSSGGAKLKHLCLYNLPKLTHIWEDSIDQMTATSCFVDILESIVVDRCDNLKCLLPSSITFSNLTFLDVERCNGMMNLFGSSVAKNLVNLREMWINECTEMRSIVVQPKGKEEGEEIIFDKLNELKLSNLTRLASFHSEKCVLKFPSLEKLKISGCPEMKTFSYGIISTPKLSHVEGEGNKVSVSLAQGLNVIIEDMWNDEIVRSIRYLYQEKLEDDYEEENFLSVVDDALG
ncbi:probable disease resistance protein At5g63020 [Benincasa hispida]|uniref:probable disease resistance protein At5g63020 n=1 Tax=Benincasa hispida TaxID=102211 RepID=UPI0019022F58|nr:probable disease resistance protein At5g63020 [Benincasa hispida]